MDSNGYAQTADELVNRIRELAKTHPEIKTITNPFRLFDAGLRCDDLQPSLAQAMWSLKKVQQEMKEAKCRSDHNNTMGLHGKIICVDCGKFIAMMTAEQMAHDWTFKGVSVPGIEDGHEQD